MAENIPTHFLIKKTLKKTRKSNVNIAYFALETTCSIFNDIKNFDWFFIRDAR